jgi:hypothetical protein
MSIALTRYETNPATRDPVGGKPSHARDGLLGRGAEAPATPAAEAVDVLDFIESVHTK